MSPAEVQRRASSGAACAVGGDPWKARALGLFGSLEQSSPRAQRGRLDAPHVAVKSLRAYGRSEFCPRSFGWVAVAATPLCAPLGWHSSLADFPVHPIYAASWLFTEDYVFLFAAFAATRLGLL